MILILRCLGVLVFLAAIVGLVLGWQQGDREDPVDCILRGMVGFAMGAFLGICLAALIFLSCLLIWFIAAGGLLPV